MTELQDFLKQFRVARYKKGEVIFAQDELPKIAYVVKKGLVKTYNISVDGDEKPISFHLENEILPTSWVFAKARRTLFFYEAFTACELYAVPKEEYIELLKANPKLLYQTFNSFVGYHIGLQLRINALEQSKAATKILNMLHFFCLRFGEERDNGVVRIRLNLTQQELANFIGLTRETVSIELKKLRQQHVISRSRQHYYVKTAKLNDLLDEDYDNQINLN